VEKFGLENSIYDMKWGGTHTLGTFSHSFLLLDFQFLGFHGLNQSLLKEKPGTCKFMVCNWMLSWLQVSLILFKAAAMPAMQVTRKQRGGDLETV
jgi:hypothetical protein